MSEPKPQPPIFCDWGETTVMVDGELAPGQFVKIDGELELLTFGDAIQAHGAATRKLLPTRKRARGGFHLTHNKGLLGKPAKVKLYLWYVDKLSNPAMGLQLDLNGEGGPEDPCHADATPAWVKAANNDPKHVLWDILAECEID